MAARRAVTVDTSTTNAVDVLVILAEDSASEDAPLSVTNIAVELNEDNATIIPLLDELEDFGLAQYENVGGQFMAWLTDPEITSTTAHDAYNKAAGIKAPKSVRKAAQPIKGNDGKNVTVPVSEGSSERRELDAAEGERVISEDNMRDVVRNLTQEDDSMDSNETQITGQWENPIQETHYVPYAEGAVTGHMLLPEPTTMAAPPEGVNPNTWELYKAGNTAPSRLFWGNKVAEQMKAHALAQAVPMAPEEETEPATPAKSFGVDPVTGEAFPF